ncbi:MAG: bifunctional folylpolyglutamate synthase/dihydrofolate synthase [Vicinamibacterales bacterium]
MTPIERLFSLEQFGIKLGLDNIRVLLDELDHPEAAWPSVHIAGTNGKGSTTAMVERAFRAAGLRTGRYTSPHLSAIEERVAIDGASVGPKAFAGVTAEVFATIDRAIARGSLSVTPTFFEVSTAIAFEIFRRERVQVAVVEVGLGGRFDATNTVSPSVTAITSIDYDHQRHLGSTLRSIAFEKAGIAKHGVPLVVGRVSTEVGSVIDDVAHQVGAPVVEANHGVTLTTEVKKGRVSVTLTTPLRAYPRTTLALAGRHQLDNALVATRVLEVWSAQMPPIRSDAIVAGLADCEWPGRLEWLRLPAGAEVLIDAAHNPSGASALADYLREAEVTPLPMVLAAMRDKDITGMLTPLTPLASEFIATTVTSRRARDAESLASDILRIAPDLPVAIEASPDRALMQALRHHDKAVVAGSIFLIGPLRARLLAEGATRV